MVQMLLQTPGVQLMDFAQAEAYSRRFPFLSPVMLPRGVVDLARDLPPQDVRLVAPTATLVAREDTHPALLQLFVQAARTDPRRRRLVPAARASSRTPRNSEMPDRRRGRALLPRRRALAAALPAVLAGQPDRPHVAGAGLDRRGADAAVAHRAAAVPVPHPLARVPLVRPAARDRRRAAGKRPADELCASSTRSSAGWSRSACRCRYADELYALRSHIRWCAPASVPARDAKGRTKNEKGRA